FLLFPCPLRLVSQKRNQLVRVVFRLWKLTRARQVDGPGKREKIGRKLVERTSRQRAQAPGGIGLEQVRAAVDRMYRLPPASFTGGVAGGVARPHLYTHAQTV